MREEFFELVCNVRQLLVIALAIEFFFLLLTLASLPYQTPGTEGYVLIVSSLVFVLFGIVVLVGLLYGCRRRRRSLEHFEADPDA